MNRLIDSDEPSSFRDRLMAMKRGRNWSGQGSGAVTEAACNAAFAFVSEAMSRCAELPLPHVAPSVLGGVALQWDFDDWGFLVRISSDDRKAVHYQEEGPNCFQSDGIATQAEVVERLLKAAGRSRGLVKS